MANMAIYLKNKLINLDSTATIYELEIPLTAELKSNEDLVELGVAVEDYGIVIVPTGTVASDEAVDMTYNDGLYHCAITTLEGGTVGSTITFVEDGGK